MEVCIKSTELSLICMVSITQSLLMAVKEKHTLNVNIKTFEYEDAFITHGATHLVEEQLGITVEQLAEVISKEFY